MASVEQKVSKSRESGDSDSSRSDSPDPLDMVESSHSSFQPSSSSGTSDEDQRSKRLAKRSPGEADDGMDRGSLQSHKKSPKKRVGRKARQVTESESEEVQRPQKSKTTRVKLKGKTMADSLTAKNNRKEVVRSQGSTWEPVKRKRSSSESDDNLCLVDLPSDSFDLDLDLETDLSSLPDLLKSKIDGLMKKLEPSPAQHKKMTNLDIDVLDVPVTHRMRYGLRRSDIKGMPGARTDLFDDEEVAQIVKNWNAFCKEYSFDPSSEAYLFLPDPFKQWCDHTRSLNLEQKKKFCQYISQGLPDRHPGAVYRKFCALYYFNRTGVYLKEETELIKAWHKHMPDTKIYSILGRVLRRRRNSIYVHLLRILGLRKTGVKVERQKEEWALGDPDTDEYPAWVYDDEVWDKIAADSKTDKNKLMRDYFCYIYPMARSTYKRPTSIDGGKFKRVIINNLIKMRPVTWDDPDWETLGKFNNVGVVAAYALVRKITTKYVPKDKWCDMEQVCDILEKRFLANGTEQKRLVKRSADADSPLETDDKEPVETAQKDTLVNVQEPVSSNQGGQIVERSEEDMEVNLVNRSNSIGQSSSMNSSHSNNLECCVDKNSENQNDVDPHSRLKRNLYDLFDSDREPENNEEPDDPQNIQETKDCKQPTRHSTPKKGTKGMESDEFNESGNGIGDNDHSQSASSKSDENLPHKKRPKKSKRKEDKVHSELGESGVSSSARIDESDEQAHHSSYQAQGSDFQEADVSMNSKMEGVSPSTEKVREKQKRRKEELDTEEKSGVKTDSSQKKEKRKSKKRKHHEESTQLSEFEVTSSTDIQAATEELCNSSLGHTEETQVIEVDEESQKKKRKKNKKKVAELHAEPDTHETQPGTKVSEADEGEKKLKNKKNLDYPESDEFKVQAVDRIDEPLIGRRSNSSVQESEELLFSEVDGGSPEKEKVRKKKKRKHDMQTEDGFQEPPTKGYLESDEFKAPSADRINETLIGSSRRSNSSVPESEELLFSEVDGGSPEKEKVRKKKKRKHDRQTEDEFQNHFIKVSGAAGSRKSSFISNDSGVQDYGVSRSNVIPKSQDKETKMDGRNQHEEQYRSSVARSENVDDEWSVKSVCKDQSNEESTSGPIEDGLNGLNQNKRSRESQIDTNHVSGKSAENHNTVSELEETRAADLTPEMRISCSSVSPQLVASSVQQLISSTRVESVEKNVCATDSRLLTLNRSDGNFGRKSTSFSKPVEVYERSPSPRKKKSSKIGSPKESERSLRDSTQIDLESWVVKVQMRMKGGKEVARTPPPLIGSNPSPRKDESPKTVSPKKLNRLLRNSSQRDIESWLANEFAKTKEADEIQEDVTSPCYVAQGTPSKEVELNGPESNCNEEPTRTNRLQTPTLEISCLTSELKSLVRDLSPSGHNELDETGKQKTTSEEEPQIPSGYEIDLGKDPEEVPKDRTPVLQRLRGRPDKKPQTKVYPIFDRKQVKAGPPSSVPNNVSAAPSQKTTPPLPLRLRKRPGTALIRKPAKVSSIPPRSRQ